MFFYYVIIGVRIFGRGHRDVGANPTRNFLGQVFLEAGLWSESVGVWSVFLRFWCQNYISKTKFLVKNEIPESVYLANLDTSHNSPDGWDRELFKPLKTRKALQFGLEIELESFGFLFFFVGDVRQGGRFGDFSMTSLGSEPQPQGEMFFHFL